MAKLTLLLGSLLVLAVTDAFITNTLRNLIKNPLDCKSNKAASQAAVASPNGYTSLFSKYSMTGAPGEDSFFSIPRQIKEVEQLGWKQPPETVSDERLSTHCENTDFRICVLLDKQGSIAGYQISIPTTVDLQDINGIDYTTKGFVKQTLFGKEVYSTKIYFVEQQVIDNGGRQWDNSTGTGIWLQAGNNLIEVPVKIEEVEAKTPFKKQNCFVRMGHHFFYDLSKDLTVDEFQPWFVLYNNEGILHGLGLIAFGSKSDSYIGDTRRSWFEDVPAPAIAAIAPDTPNWILETITRAGIYSQHIFIQDEPWNYKCPAQSAAIKHY